MAESNIKEKTVKKEKQNKKRVEAIRRYLGETKSEFKKIVWPTANVVIRNTIVVLVMILAIGAVIWCLDALTSTGINAILKNY